MEFPKELWKIIKNYRGMQCEGATTQRGLCGRGCEKTVPWYPTGERWCPLCDPGNEYFDEELPEYLEEEYPNDITLIIFT